MGIVSLNDLDKKLHLLEESSFTDSDLDSCNERVPKSTNLSIKRKETLRMINKRRRKGLSTVCFQFLTSSCAYGSECLFRHVYPSDLLSEDKSEIMNELRSRPFESKLMNIIRDLNIPACKQFSRSGDCKFKGKCQFWHIDSSQIAKWAGFDFFCEVCLKGFTSISQLEEHKRGKFHFLKAQEQAVFQTARSSE